MSLNVNRLFQTTTVRNVVRGAVSSVVGALVAWGTTKWASLSTGSLSYLVPVFSSAYFGLIHLLEGKYPQLGWLLGVLPNKPEVVVPAPVPAPEPAPIPVKENDPVANKAPAAKKAAPKK